MLGHIDDQKQSISRMIPVDNIVKWPQLGDDPFVKGNTDDAHLDWFGDLTEFEIGTGFRLAAEAAIQMAIDKPTYYGARDNLVYPAGYLYRHYLELRLKHFVDRATEYLSCNQINCGRNNQHNLSWWWDTARDLIGQVWPESITYDHGVVEAVIRRFHELDRTGDGFRYKDSLRGARNLQNAPRVISYSNLLEVMQKTTSFFDEICLGIEELLDRKRDHED